MNLKKKNMALKDHENDEQSKDRNLKDTNGPGKNKSENSRNITDTGASNVEMNQTRQTRVSERPHVSEQGSSVNVSRRRNRHTESGDSEENFLSSLNINPNHLLGLAGVVAGGTLLFRGIKGNWPFTSKTSKIDIHTKQTVKRSREELYSYWRNFENLPNFMSHLEDVEEINDKRSHWTAEIPGGLGTIDWEARITEEEENEYISWKSLPNSEIKNSGEVTFRDASGGKGTIVETTISYHPPAGKVGDYAAKLLNPAFEKIVKRDLKQFKKHMEENGRSNSGKDLY